MSESKPMSRLRRLLNLRNIIVLAVLLALVPLAGYLLQPYWYMKGNFMPGFDFKSYKAHQDQLEADRAAHQTAQAQAPPALIDDAPAWPRYRGPNGDGIAPAEGFMESWPAGGPPVAYRQPIGSGYAGFVIGGGRAYTIEQRRGDEVIACYDFATGIELWTHTYRAFFTEMMGGEGPRATPTLDGERLYALGAEGDLHCLNALTGEVVWRRNILRGMTNLQWAMSGSPLILDNLVLVTGSGIGGDSIFALDKLTGEPVWSSLPEQQAYSTLLEAEIAGRRVVLNLAADKLNAIDPANGERLWSFPWLTQNGINCSQPIPVGDDRVFLSSGYGQGAALIEVRAANGGYEVAELWSNSNMKNKFNSSVVHEGYVYGLDEGVMACVELATGARQWKAGRYGHGQILLAGAQLFVLGEDGSLTFLAADPAEHRVLGTAKPLDGKTWNTMALAGGRLLVRNHREMSALDLRPQSPS
jgi:outer membrane protein assembly factor BamB